MSSGQIPRTPDYFPSMKYRARKRKNRFWIPPWVKGPDGWAASLDDFGICTTAWAASAELGIDLDEEAA
ncbi:hypothetical protein [Nocardia flavorosea]|uniref:Uncharacterized protein n=1 Tax=Nocardia flavorosea TaxID=53429 RepID=A0A846YLC3_9NOCA|nr:hypothetical protein [Nocardia flavorosea]NKY60446.1 hypothetical protein [Nocardia flavorosea]